MSSSNNHLGSGPSTNGTNGHHNNSLPKKSQSSKADFASVLKKWSAPIPPALSRKLGRGSESPLGKVKVMLRVCDNAEEVSGSGILGLDQRRKQVTLIPIDPGGTSNGITPEERRVGVSAPKMFAFDGIFGEDDDQAEICAASAAELVGSVIGGEDGCLVSLGYCSAGKRQTMFGKPSNQQLGAVPTAISWLFKSIQEQKQKTGSRFSVRVSAVEVTGGSVHETITDLLLPFVNDGDQPPGAYLLDANGSTGSKSVNAAPVLNSVSEVRSPNPETAGFYLDSALESVNSREDKASGGHFIFTLHVYQYSIDKNGKGVVGGRSRLHCVLLGNGSPSISVLSGLLLAVLNNQRHLSSSNHSKLGGILRECLGSLTCRAVVMMHISNSRNRYAETLAALQLGSRIHRLRRSRRFKMGSVGSGTGSGGSSGGSGEEMRNGLGTTNQVCEGETGSSDIDPSSSEQSCDTVIYLGPSIDEATDGEHPPVYLPSLDTTENGCEAKIVPSKCPPLSANGALPKTKSPKPKSSNKLPVEFNANGGGINRGKSEEKWIDGPKVTNKFRQLQNQLNSVSGGNSCPPASPKKKGETWIDGPRLGGGPADRVNHQASNFPSPKKTVNNHSHQNHLQSSSGLLRSIPSAAAPSSLDPCCMTSTKAEMIQKWISNQNHSPTFFDDISQLDDTFFAGQSNASHVFNGSSGNGFQKIPAPGGNNIPYFFNQDNPHLNNFVGGGNTGFHDQEYKSLTVFKTCEDEDEDEAAKEDADENYEFEFIEVVEPDVPVPTRDVCLQVTEEDIALSYLEENPLPESDQNIMMMAEKYYERMRSASFSEGPPESSCLSTDGKSENHHPLRVLSQECLTVVSTFADSTSMSGDMERFWPGNGFNLPFHIGNHDNQQGKTCNGLCKNLVTLSQMSLDNLNDFPLNETMSLSSMNFGQNGNHHQNHNNHTPPEMEQCNHKPPTGKIILKDPPILSPDSIFKTPPVPKPRNSSLTSLSRRTSGKDSSDAEQDNISIPPMELLDVNQIKNNCHPIENQLQSMKSPKVQPKLVHHAGCDHNHHHQLKNGHQIMNINGPNSINGSGNNGKLIASGNSNGSSLSIHSSHSTLTTPPSSPSPIIPISVPADTNGKSPSKSKSRKIAKFFRTRSKSPKKVVVPTTSSSESGKSSASSTDKHSSSSSSCSSGVSLPPNLKSNNKPHLSPIHQGKKSALKVHPSFSNSTAANDYHFTCDSDLPMFLPSPNNAKVLTSIENGNAKLNGQDGQDKIKLK